MASREAKLTNILMLGALILAAISAYLIFTQFRDLKSARTELDQTRAELAAAKADQLYVQDATYGTMVFLDDTPLGLLCKNRPSDSYVQRLCQSQSDYTALLRLFSAATRSRAATPRDYARTKQNYEEFARYLKSRPADPLRDAWLARALEGVAYSEMKLGQSQRAEATIRNAVSLDPNSGMVALTALKVACDQRTDPAKVRQELAAFKQKLDERVTSVSADPRMSEVARRSTQMERDLLDQDEELAFLCSYAGIGKKA